MKNFFSIDMENNNEKNEYPQHIKPYVLREVDSNIAKRQEEATERIKDFDKQWMLPKWLSVIKSLFSGFGIVILAVLISSAIETGEGLFSTPRRIAFALAGIVLFGTAIALSLWERKRRATVEASQEFKDFVSYVESLSASVENALFLPSDKVEVDVFYYPCKDKNGKIKDNPYFKYLNQSVDLFTENGKLCLADGGGVIGIDINAFTGIQVNPKRVSFAGWGKDQAYNKGIYKEYKMTVDSRGVLHVKNSCSVQFTLDGENYELVIPPYELPHFERLLGMKAQLLSNDEDNGQEEVITPGTEKVDKEESNN